MKVYTKLLKPLSSKALENWPGDYSAFTCNITNELLQVLDKTRTEETAPSPTNCSNTAFDQNEDAVLCCTYVFFSFDYTPIGGHTRGTASVCVIHRGIINFGREPELI